MQVVGEPIHLIKKNIISHLHANCAKNCLLGHRIKCSSPFDVIRNRVFYSIKIDQVVLKSCLYSSNYPIYKYIPNYKAPYGKKLTKYFLAKDLEGPLENLSLHVCIRLSWKTWQAYKKYFHGLGRKKAALAWDKCLTNSAHTSNKTYQGKLVKENLLTAHTRK